jgi:DNA ligase-1
VDDDDDDDVQPTKKTRKPASKGKSKGADDVKPASKSRKPNSTSRRKVKDEDEDEEDEAASEDEDEDESAPVTKNVPELLLANKWDLDTGLDPVGWWISEKLDGVRFVNSVSMSSSVNLHTLAV